MHSTPSARDRQEELVGLLDEGILRVVVEKVYAFEEALEVHGPTCGLKALAWILMLMRGQAYDRILSQRSKGKQIIKVEGGL